MHDEGIIGLTLGGGAVGVQDLVEDVDSVVTDDSEDRDELEGRELDGKSPYNDSTSGLTREELIEMLDTEDGVLDIVLAMELSSGDDGGASRTITSEGSTESEGRRNEVSKDASTPS